VLHFRLESAHPVSLNEKCKSKLPACKRANSSYLIRRNQITINLNLNEAQQESTVLMVKTVIGANEQWVRE
jgi:hypothetical protein